MVLEEEEQVREEEVGEEEVLVEEEEVMAPSGGISQGGASSSGSEKFWRRGGSHLPKRPLKVKPVIQPIGEKHWKKVGQDQAKSTRMVNGIIGLLLKEHFPGLVKYKGKEEPPWTREHYEAAPDAQDRSRHT